MQRGMWERIGKKGNFEIFLACFILHKNTGYYMIKKGEIKGGKLVPKTVLRASNEEKPFLMVSYAHKNADIVLPVIERLRKAGINIWIDKNIIPREVWDNEIAVHIQDCEIMLAFLSKEYMASDNCMEELRYAKDQNQAILPVCITDVQLPPGLQMRMASRQMVYMEQFNDVSALVDRLCLCKEVERCREPAVKSPIIPQSGDLTETQEPVKRLRRPLRFRLPGKITLGISALLVIVLAFLLLFLSDEIQLYEDLAVSVNDTAIVISGRSVDKEVLEKLGTLESLTSLTFRECEFTPFSMLYINFPEAVQHLTFDQCEGISLLFAAKQENLLTLAAEDCGIENANLPARMPKGLTELSLSGNPGISNISCLSECTQLVSLDISGTAVSSLDDIAGDSLQSIDFSDTKISTVQVMSGWEKLTTVRGNNTPLISITPLAQLKNLKEIEFSGCSLLGPAESFLSLRLEKLNLSDNVINQLDAFANCTILTEVDLSGNQLMDVSVLEKSSAVLKKLNLSGNPLSEEDLESLLASCSELTELDLDGIVMECLPALSHMHKLEWLSASGCGLKSISRLDELISKYQLRYLCLSDNYIREIELLYTENRVQNLTLDLGCNPVETLIFLPNGHYECLVLLHNLIDATHLVKSIEGKTLVISAGRELTEQIAKEDFEQIFLVNCPLDERVQVEDHFGIERVTFLENDEELIDCMDQLGLDYHFLETVEPNPAALE